MRRHAYKLVTLPLLLVAILLSAVLLQPYKLWLNTQQESDMQQFATNVNSFVLSQLREPIYISVGVSTYIQTLDGNIDELKLNRWLNNLFDYTEHTKNIGVAPNNVIEHIYPLAGNEAALGLRLAEVPGQGAVIQRLVEGASGQLTGPITLVQGGQAFAYREAIRINGQYWGLVSTIIDAESIYGALHDYLEGSESFNISLSNTEGVTFFSTGGLEQKGRFLDVSQTVPLPGTEWTIHVKSPQPTQSFFLFFIVSTVILFSLFLLMLWVFYSYRKRAEEKQKLHKSQSEFLASVSHELKTPITVLQGSLSLLKQPQLPEESREGLIDRALIHQKRLSRLVLDLVDLNLALNDQLRCKLELIPLNLLAQEIAGRYKDDFEHLGINFHTQLASTEKLLLKTDSAHLSRVLEHLLDNASKFCKRGDSVSFGIEANESVQIWIKDTGPGIPLSLVESKGLYFNQQDSTDSREQSGIGMGLALCFEIVNVLGAEMKIARGDSRGTHISIKFPSDLVSMSSSVKESMDE